MQIILICLACGKKIVIKQDKGKPKFVEGECFACSKENKPYKESLDA